MENVRVDQKDPLVMVGEWYELQFSECLEEDGPIVPIEDDHQGFIETCLLFDTEAAVVAALKANAGKNPVFDAAVAKHYQEFSNGLKKTAVVDYYYTRKNGKIVWLEDDERNSIAHDERFGFPVENGGGDQNE